MTDADTSSAGEVPSSSNLAPVSKDDPGRPGLGYEYLDHTADVQLHAWGSTLKEAFEQVAKAMFGYMTELDSVEEQSTYQIEVSGHDLQSALYGFLDEWLFAFSADPFFLPFKVEIVEFQRPPSDGDDQRLETEGEVIIKAVGYGETFDLGKHPQGTEVKAITYSAMQINEYQDFAEVFVIIDI